MSAKPCQQTTRIPLAAKRQALASLIRTHSLADHKGSSGRVVVLGGSADYTGAPYFAASAALRAGCDMATVVTTPSAASAIKALSPDLIVRGIIPPPCRPHNRHPQPPASCADSASSSPPLPSSASPQHKLLFAELSSLLSKSHCLVIGPGLATNQKYFHHSHDHDGCVGRDGMRDSCCVDPSFSSACDADGFGKGEICSHFAEWLKRIVVNGGGQDEGGQDEGQKQQQQQQQQESAGSTLIITPQMVPPMVIDASGIPLLADALTLRGGARKGTGECLAAQTSIAAPPLVITPNVNEINILFKACCDDEACTSKENKSDQQKDQSTLPTTSSSTTISPSLLSSCPSASSPSRRLSFQDKAVIVSDAMQCCVLLKGREDFVAFKGTSIGHVDLSLVFPPPEGRAGREDGEKTSSSSEPTTTMLDSESDEHEQSSSSALSLSISPCPRRVAGQGDILSGLVGTFLAWGRLSSEAGNKTKTNALASATLSSAGEEASLPLEVRAAIAASIVMKLSALATAADDDCDGDDEEKEARRRGNKRARSFLTSDILPFIGRTIDRIEALLLNQK